MARKRQEGMTDRETEIMSSLWSRDESTAEDVRSDLGGHLADSTVRTMLSVMESKGYVSSRMGGRIRVYRAFVERSQAQSKALDSIVRRLFQGSPDALVARLVDDEHLSLEELDQLRAALSKARKED
jgi:BlaI family transcriptional regulator, penicillinase repressor